MNKLFSLIITFAVLCRFSCNDQNVCQNQIASSSLSSCNDISSSLDSKFACCWVEKKQEEKDKKEHVCRFLEFNLTVIEKEQTRFENLNFTDVRIMCLGHILSYSLLLMLFLLML